MAPPPESREARRKPLIVLLLLLTAAWLMLHRRPAPVAPALPHETIPAEPATMLWAWETPEDLTALDPARTGVAFLARSIALTSSGVTVQPRRQPLRVPPNIYLMAVVRMEATPGFTPTRTTATDAARAIASAVALPNIRSDKLGHSTIPR